MEEKLCIVILSYYGFVPNVDVCVVVQLPPGRERRKYGRMK